MQNERKPPETLGQFLLLLGRGFISGLKWKLILAAIVALLSWVIHTYLLVVINEGFSPGSNPTLDLILALSDRIPSAILVWTLLTALLTALVFRMIRVGVGPTLRAIAGTPGWLWAALRQAGLMSLGILFVGGAGFALLVATVLNQRMLSLQLALLGSGILIVREGSVLFTASRLGWSDLQRLFKRHSPTTLNLHLVGLATFGVTLGLWLAVILPFYPYSHVFLIMLALLGAIALSVGGVFRPRMMLFLILFIGLAFAVRPILADDGGWSESGGTLSGWLTSEGAVRAIAQGIFPAMGAGLGVLLGAMAGAATTGLAGSPLSSGLSGQSVPAGKMGKGSADASPKPDIHQRHRPEPDLGSGQKAQSPPQSGGLASGQKGGEPPQPVIARHEQAGVSAGQKGSEPPQTLISGHQRQSTPGPKADTPDLAEQSAAPSSAHHRAAGQPAESSPAEQMQDILQRERPAGSAPASQAIHSPAGASQAKIGPPDRTGQSQSGSGTPGRYGEGQSPHAQPAEPVQPPAAASQAAHPPATVHGEAASVGKVSDKMPPAQAEPRPAIQPAAPPAGATQAARPGEIAQGVSKGDALAGASQAARPEGIAQAPAPNQPLRPPMVESPATLMAAAPLIVTPLTWQLTITAGYGLGQDLPLGEVTKIGRERGQDIQLLDPKTSRQHAEIRLQGNACQLVDLNSRNGTYVNGRRISEPNLLNDGDTIRIGDTHFLVKRKV